MAPWIEARLRDSWFVHRLHQPVCGLVVLLQEIEQEAKRGLVLMEGPQTVVVQQGMGMHLFREGRHLAFATFEVLNHHGIASVGLRYQDPINSASGRDSRILDGWTGVAELLASAVRNSAHWKRLETIEVATSMDSESPAYANAVQATTHFYEVWATPRKYWDVNWAERGYNYGLTFHRNVPVCLARITVERTVAEAYDDGFIAEIVRNVELYPYRETDLDLYPLWGDDELELSKIQPPQYLAVEDRLLRFGPHDEIRANWK